MTGFLHSTRVLMTAFAHMTPLHPMFPHIARDNITHFRAAVEKANIERIAFLRHGNTGPSLSGHDFDRFLTFKGQEQVREAALSFGKDLKPVYPSVLVSSAPRTMETARIFLDSIDTGKDVQRKPVRELYDETMQPEGSALFRTIGYAPLSKYLDNPIEKDRETARRLLGDYALVSIQTILDTLGAQTNNDGLDRLPSTLCVVAHAIYLPAAALGVASLLGCQGLELCLTTNTQEAEGYLIHLGDNTVSILSRT
eukprot:Nitzschia sp. Nitz4//scaffold6_size259037//199628//200389//NITZ4_001106-RA/size259037-processed-gene-0.88-mRNA-1//-1//CDS//3329556989//7487//frame0